MSTATGFNPRNPWLYIVLFWLVVLFSSTTHAIADEIPVRYSDYSMLTQRWAYLIADRNGAFAAEVVIEPQSPTVSHIQWRVPGQPPTYWEVFELKDNPATGSKWWFLTKFCSPGGCDVITTQRAVLSIGGQTFEIARPDVEGHPYAPELFTAPYVITIWAETGPTPFYWKAAMAMPVDVTNPLWNNDVQKTRKALRQDEVWWSQTGGWEEGGSDTQWSRYNYLGKGAGIGFAGKNFGWWEFGIAWAWPY